MRGHVSRTAHECGADFILLFTPEIYLSEAWHALPHNKSHRCCTERTVFHSRAKFTDEGSQEENKGFVENVGSAFWYFWFTFELKTTLIYYLTESIFKKIIRVEFNKWLF